MGASRAGGAGMTPEYVGPFKGPSDATGCYMHEHPVMMLLKPIKWCTMTDMFAQKRPTACAALVRHAFPVASMRRDSMSFSCNASYTPLYSASCVISHDGRWITWSSDDNSCSASARTHSTSGLACFRPSRGSFHTSQVRRWLRCGLGVFGRNGCKA